MVPARRVVICVHCYKDVAGLVTVHTVTVAAYVFFLVFTSFLSLSSLYFLTIREIILYAIFIPFNII
jgi:hypothetical protein